MFQFGFEQQKYTFNEITDEGLQDIPFSAAPGYETEKSFDFSIEITPLQGNFMTGCKFNDDYIDNCFTINFLSWFEKFK